MDSTNPKPTPAKADTQKADIAADTESWRHPTLKRDWMLYIHWHQRALGVIAPDEIRKWEKEQT